MAKNEIKLNIPNIINNYPQSASVISKLNASDTKQTFRPQDLNLRDISMSVKDKVGTNDDIVELFPDVELAIQILISSVLSPNDMVNITLQYIPPTISLPTNVKQTLIDIFQRHMEDNYDLVTKLPTILRESLFTKGAYIEAIIPESSLDDVINQTGYNNFSMESFLQSTNGKYNYLSREEHVFKLTTNNRKDPIEITREDIGLTITDNPNVLLYAKKLTEYNRKQARQVSSSAIKFSTESDEMILDKLFRPSSTYTQNEYVAINLKDDASRESIGKPLVMKLPVEAVIPIHVTSDPSKHLGYFIALDENGNPLDIRNEALQFNENMSNMTFLNTTTSNSLINKAKMALTGMSSDIAKIGQLQEIYNDIVEQMIKDKVKKGLFGELADLKENADVYRVMFSRALKSQQTKVLFLPSELVAYYAFEYRDNGTGKSLIEKNTLLYSIRAILLFARMMASVKNSISTTVVQATLDEDDPDPETTREKIISEALKTRQAAIPLGLIRPDDLTEWAHKVGFMFKVDHPALPNIQLDVSDQSTNKIIPDEELDTKLAERILMAYGLTPEIVMAGYSSDFATTVASRNLLFAKRCTTTQLTFMPQVTEHIKKIARNDSVLVEKLTNVIKTNIKDIKSLLRKSDNEEEDINLKKISEARIVDYLIDKYINFIEVKLPAIVFTDANALRASFDAWKDNLETYLDATINTSMFADKYAGKLSEEIDAIKEVIKGMAISKWAANNNFIPEVNDIYTKDDEGKPEFDVFAEYLNYKDSIQDLYVPFLKAVAKNKTKTNSKLEKVLGDLDSSGGDSYGSDDSSGSDDYGSDDSGGGDEYGTDDSGGDDGTGGDEGGSEGGDDDFGMDDDLTGGDEGGADAGDEGGDEATGDEADEADMGTDTGGGDDSNNTDDGNDSNADDNSSDTTDDTDTGDTDDTGGQEPEEKEDNKDDENNEEDVKAKEEEEKKKKEEEEAKKKEEEEKKKAENDKNANEAYELDLARVKIR